MRSNREKTEEEKFLADQTAGGGLELRRRPG
jgi:hypothetical protein